jgi:hypothetical protein
MNSYLKWKKENENDEEISIVESECSFDGLLMNMCRPSLPCHPNGQAYSIVSGHG